MPLTTFSSYEKIIIYRKCKLLKHEILYEFCLFIPSENPDPKIYFYHPRSFIQIKTSQKHMTSQEGGKTLKKFYVLTRIFHLYRDKLLSLKKWTVIRRPWACVSNRNLIFWFEIKMCFKILKHSNISL